MANLELRLKPWLTVSGRAVFEQTDGEAHPQVGS
jgi:hypothetical protein